MCGDMTEKKVNKGGVSNRIKRVSLAMFCSLFQKKRWTQRLLGQFVELRDQDTRKNGFPFVTVEDLLYGLCCLEQNAARELWTSVLQGVEAEKLRPWDGSTAGLINAFGGDLLANKRLWFICVIFGGRKVRGAFRDFKAKLSKASQVRVSRNEPRFLRITDSDSWFSRKPRFHWLWLQIGSLLKTNNKAFYSSEDELSVFIANAIMASAIDRLSLKTSRNLRTTALNGPVPLTKSHCRPFPLTQVHQNGKPLPICSTILSRRTF